MLKQARERIAPWDMIIVGGGVIGVEPFTGCCNLTDADAGIFEVMNFFTQRECDLFCRIAAWLVVANETPL